MLLILLLWVPEGRDWPVGGFLLRNVVDDWSIWKVGVAMSFCHRLTAKFWFPTC